MMFYKGHMAIVWYGRSLSLSWYLPDRKWAYFSKAAEDRKRGMTPWRRLQLWCVAVTLIA